LGNDWANPSSSLVKKEPNDRYGADVDDDTLYHVRRRLPKFDELRRETAQAFQLLVHLARCQQGNRAHLAVASFLEWRQVVALMVGSGGDGTNGISTTYDSILALHTHHAHQWAVQEASSLTLHSVPASKNSTLDDRLDALARAVEIDPCSLEHWRALVAQLGAVACTSDAVSCTNADCKECSRVNQGFAIDHAALYARRQAGRWWGLHRSQWWYESLLQQTSRANPNTNASGRPIVLDGETAQCIHVALRDALGEHDTAQSLPRGASNSADCKEFDHAKHVQWIDGLVQGPNAAQEESNDRADGPVDHLLPTTYQERCGETNTHDKPLDPLLLEGPDSMPCELLTYKVLILCHLYSTLHLGVDVGIDRLIVDMAWDDESSALLLDSNAVQCLRWLRRRGLDVATVFLQTQSVGIDSLQTW
jgi:hypothetical protein